MDDIDKALVCGFRIVKCLFRRSFDDPLAVNELLNELAEIIWERYELPLIKLLASECDPNASSKRDLFDVGDPVPV